MNVQYDPLLNPKPQPSARTIRLIDRASWLLPVLAAIFSVGAGGAALFHADIVAAILGIIGGVASAFGVLATGRASKIRDDRLEVAYSLGNLGIEMADRAMSRTPGSF